MNPARHIHDDTKRAVKTLWSWLRGAAVGQPAAEPNPATQMPDGATDTSARRGVVLAFPVRGEALLVKLAEVLRCKIAAFDRSCHGLLPMLDHDPDLRLWIGDDAHVVFDGRSSEYHLTIETPSGTRMIIQTVDFDALVTFVLQYVSERLADAALLEVAS
ncbi:MAG: hypothetical protein JWO15_3896 [Sphingomonadales bacterium]|nr:hypothetical protein [Sphingomonadales bacterium]